MISKYSYRMLVDRKVLYFDLVLVMMIMVMMVIDVSLGYYPTLLLLTSRCS